MTSEWEVMQAIELHYLRAAIDLLLTVHFLSYVRVFPSDIKNAMQP